MKCEEFSFTVESLIEEAKKYYRNEQIKFSLNQKALIISAFLIRDIFERT